MVGRVIGEGGRILRQLQMNTGCKMRYDNRGNMLVSCLKYEDLLDGIQSLHNMPEVLSGWSVTPECTIYLPVQSFGDIRAVKHEIEALHSVRLVIKWKTMEVKITGGDSDHVAGAAAEVASLGSIPIFRDEDAVDDALIYDAKRRANIREKSAAKTYFERPDSFVNKATAHAAHGGANNCRSAVDPASDKNRDKSRARRSA